MCMKSLLFGICVSNISCVTLAGREQKETQKHNSRQQHKSKSKIFNLWNKQRSSPGSQTETANLTRQGAGEESESGGVSGRQDQTDKHKEC